MSMFPWLTLAVSTIFTNPFASTICDSIKIVRGDPFLEVHYWNSAEKCSYSGEFPLDLESVRVLVTVSIGKGEDSREYVQVNVLDNLPFTVEPANKVKLLDGEMHVFTLVPMMF